LLSGKTFRPEDVVLSADSSEGAENTFIGKVAHRVFLGDVIDYLIDMGGQELRVRARPEWVFAIGAAVMIALPPVKCVGIAELDDRRTVDLDA